MPPRQKLSPEERLARYAESQRRRDARHRKKKRMVPVYFAMDRFERLRQLVSQTGSFTVTDFVNDAFDFYEKHLEGVMAAAAQAHPSLPCSGPVAAPEITFGAIPAEPLEIVTQEPPPQPLEFPTEAQPEPAEALQIVTAKIAETPAKTPKPGARKHAKPPAKEPPKKPRNMWRQRDIDRATADAANRVPVRLEFTWPHHHIPWGMRQMMWSNGLKHRKNIWRGRLTPARAETMREEIAKYGGTLEITGALGEEPKWTREEWGGPGRQAKAVAPAEVPENGNAVP